MKKVLLSLLTIISMLALLSFTACIEDIPSTDSGSDSGNSVVETTTYTVTWLNEDGTVLETDEGVEEGTMATYDGETPTKEATAQYTYEFAGWDVTPAEVTADVTYTATFTATAVTYTVKWLDAEGGVYDSETVEYEGTIAILKGPAKQSDADYVYTFAGWDANDDGEVDTVNTTVTENVTYKPVYTKEVNPNGWIRKIFYASTNATVTFNDENTTVDATATADNMYLYMKGDQVLNYSNDKDYMKIVVESLGVSFQIVPMNAQTETSDGNWEAYPFSSIVGGTDTFYVSLKDANVHDFENYDLRLYVGYAGQAMSVNVYFLNANEIDTVYTVRNGTDNGNLSYTATGNMEIYLDRNKILFEGENKDFLKLTVGSTTMASFGIVKNYDKENMYIYETMGGSGNVYYIPLNDVTIHDFQNYHLMLTAAAGQNITIENIEYVNLADLPAFVYAPRNCTVDGNTYTATGDMKLYMSLWRIRFEGKGKDLLKLTLGSTTMAEFTLQFGNTVYAYETLGGTGNAYYIPMSDFDLVNMNSVYFTMTAKNGQNIVVENVEYVNADALPNFVYVNRRASQDGNTYTATENNMELYLSLWRIKFEGKGKDLLKLTLSSSTGASLKIKLASTVYVYDTLMGTETYWIPMSDVNKAISTYFVISADYAGQSITIDSVEYVNADALPDFVYAPRNCTVEGNSYTQSGSTQMTLYMSLWRIKYEGMGKDYLKLTLGSTTVGGVEFTLKFGNTTYYYGLLGGTDNVFYVPLSDFNLQNITSVYFTMTTNGEGQNITIEKIQYVTEAEKNA